MLIFRKAQTAITFQPTKLLLYSVPICAKSDLFKPNCYTDIHICIFQQIPLLLHNQKQHVMQQLLSLVRQKLGRTLESPADFECLSEQIQHSIGEYLSPTTLKRLFGYIPQTGTPRPVTLSIMARYAGFAGWQDYLDKQHVESDFFSTKRIKTSELKQGQKLSIAWNPNRECLIEYLGENSFVVLHSTNAKLHTGDRFTASHFILGQPLTATDVITIRQNSPQLTTYVAGAQTGLTKIEILDV